MNNNTVPTPRVDKNGRVVTRHMKTGVDPKSSKLPLPPPAPVVKALSPSSQRDHIISELFSGDRKYQSEFTQYLNELPDNVIKDIYDGLNETGEGDYIVAIVNRSSSYGSMKLACMSIPLLKGIERVYGSEHSLPGTKSLSVIDQAFKNEFDFMSGTSYGNNLDAEMEYDYRKHLGAFQAKILLDEVIPSVKRCPSSFEKLEWYQTIADNREMITRSLIPLCNFLGSISPRDNQDVHGIVELSRLFDDYPDSSSILLDFYKERKEVNVAQMRAVLEEHPTALISGVL